MTTRRGLTLFQLLTLLGLLGVGAAFLMPLLAKAQAEASRRRTTDNLRTLGFACANHDTQLKSLPAGNDKNNFSAAARLLPYLEQDALTAQIDFKKPCDDDANAPVRKVVIKTFLSPSDPVTQVTDGAGATNYVFNAGTQTSLTANNGVFYQDSAVKLATIADGLSNTVMIVETLKGDGGKKAIDVKRQHIAYKAAELKNLKDESGADDFKDNKNVAADRCASWMDGRFLQGTFNATRAPNDARPDVTCGGAGGLMGPRTLCDKVPVLMCDGSVRFMPVTVKFEIWQSLCNPTDGQVFDLNF